MQKRKIINPEYIKMLEPVSLDIARILKQKGFNETCDDYWEEGLNSSTPDKWKLNYYEEAATDSIKAPTLLQTVMWLYKTHNIWIGVNQKVVMDRFYWNIVIDPNMSPIVSTNEINSPEKAYQEAILFTLCHLI